MIPFYDQPFVNHTLPCFCPHDHDPSAHPNGPNIVQRQIKQGRLSWRVANLCCSLGLTTGLHLFCGMVEREFENQS